MALPRPSRVRYQVLVAACTLAIIVYVHRVGFARALPHIKDSFELENYHLGWLTAAFLIAYGGFEMPWGLAGDRWGVRHLLPLIVIGWSLVTGWVALAGSLAGLLVLRFLFGFFQAGAFPLLSRMMTDWMPTQERGKAQGLIWMATRLGGMIIPLGLGALIAWWGSWEAPLWIVATLGVVWAIAFWPWFRNTPQEMPHVNMEERALIEQSRRPAVGTSSTGIQESAGALQTSPPHTGIQEPKSIGISQHGPTSSTPSTAIQQPSAPSPVRPSAGFDRTTDESAVRSIAHGPIPWRRFLSSRSVWSLCFMYGCGGFAANFYVTLLPTYLSRHRHLSETETNWLSSLPFLCGAVACLLGGLFSDALIRATGNLKWGRRLNGTVGTLIGGFGWLSINWVDSTWALAFVLCLIFFCNDLAMGPAWAACADIGERLAGTLGGAMNMIGNLAGAVGGIVAGYLFQENLQLLFVIYAISFWCGTLCWQGVDATQKLTSHDSDDVAPHAAQ